MKTVAWWEIPRTTKKLRRWVAALLPSSWRILISPTGTGYMHREGKTVQANPNMFPLVSAKEQYRLTQAIFSHEVFHVWYTDGYWGDTILKRLTNTLEDERIERLGTSHHKHLKPLLLNLGRKMRSPVDRATIKVNDKNAHVLQMCLIWRWWHRGIANELHPLFYWQDDEDTPDNEEDALLAMYGFVGATDETIEFWEEEIQPIVEEAWMAKSTQHVNVCASDILAKLEIDPSKDAGDVNGGEMLPSDMPSSGEAMCPSPEDQEVDNVGVGKIPDMPDLPPMSLEYRDPTLIERKAQQLNQSWVDQLVIKTVEPYHIPHRNKGDFSVRNYLNRENRPFSHLVRDTGNSRDLAIGIALERSGSISARRMNENIRLATMQLYLACTKLNIPISICYTGGWPQSASLFPFTTTETDEHKALIAGYEGRTANECLSAGIQTLGSELVRRTEAGKVYIIVTDGEPVDEYVRDIAQNAARLRKKGVRTLGIYLDGNDPHRLKHIRVIKEICEDVIVTSVGEFGQNLVRTLRKNING